MPSSSIMDLTPLPSFSLLLFLPATVLAFQDVRTGHQFRLEPNIEGIRSAFWASFRCSTLVAHHSGSERVDHALRSIEHNLRIRSGRTTRVSQPVRQVPSRFGNCLQMPTDVGIAVAGCDVVG